MSLGYFEYGVYWFEHLLSVQLLIVCYLMGTTRMKLKNFLHSPLMSQQLLDASVFHVQPAEALTGNLF